eukprot:366067-Chlamydomonas_euryale.AAC.15
MRRWLQGGVAGAEGQQRAAAAGSHRSRLLPQPLPTSPPCMSARIARIHCPPDAPPTARLSKPPDRPTH